VKQKVLGERALRMRRFKQACAEFDSCRVPVQTLHSWTLNSTKHYKPDRTHFLSFRSGDGAKKNRFS
jgi:hypothetical protein